MVCVLCVHGVSLVDTWCGVCVLCVCMVCFTCVYMVCVLWVLVCVCYLHRMCLCVHGVCLVCVHIVCECVWCLTIISTRSSGNIWLNSSPGFIVSSMLNVGPLSSANAPITSGVSEAIQFGSTSIIMIHALVKVINGLTADAAYKRRND